MASADSGNFIWTYIRKTSFNKTVQREKIIHFPNIFWTKGETYMDIWPVNVIKILEHHKFTLSKTSKGFPLQKSD